LGIRPYSTYSSCRLGFTGNRSFAHDAASQRGQTALLHACRTLQPAPKPHCRANMMQQVWMWVPETICYKLTIDRHPSRTTTSTKPINNPKSGTIDTCTMACNVLALCAMSPGMPMPQRTALLNENPRQQGTTCVPQPHTTAPAKPQQQVPARHMHPQRNHQLPYTPSHHYCKQTGSKGEAQLWAGRCCTCLRRLTRQATSSLLTCWH
jgi:hypothetical protein